MNGLYNETNGLLEHVHRSLANLERVPNQEQAQNLEGHIKTQIDLINVNCSKLDALVAKQPITERRNAKYKVDQLRYDAQHLKAALYTLSQKIAQKWRLDQERADLFNRKFTTNAENSSTTIALDDIHLSENDKLKSATLGIDNMISGGLSILENLKHQGASLSGVRRKLRNFGQTLGLSNSTMKFIERRTTQDKYILFGGMILTLVIMFLLYKLLKS